MEVLCRLSYSGVGAMISAMPTRGTTAVVLLVLLAACSHGEPASTFRTATLEISTEANGIVDLHVQVADDEAERERGLMDRTTVAPFDGMAFVWPDPVESSFWMKDTLIPLSIAFWDEGGRIVSILDMAPCREDPCQTYDAGTPFVGALEVPQGELERRGVMLGDSVELVTPR
jgi:uncharacterized membrane protein (UPF0127 family)